MVQSASSTHLEIAGDVIFIGAGQITLAGPDPGNNVIESDGKAATLDNSSNTISGTGQLINTKLTLFNEGLIDADDPGGQLTLGGASITNDGGPLEATNGGILSILDNVNDSGGTIAAVGGIVRDFGTITGGTVEIGRGGTLILGSGGKTTADVQFTGPNSTLVLEASSSNVGGNVVGAGVTDDFDFQFVSFSSAVQAVWQQNGSTGTLSLVKSGSRSPLTLAGHYTSANFTPMTDGGSGTLVTVTSWDQIDGGSPTAMVAGNFQGLGSSQFATSESGTGTYIWSNGVGWAQIDGGVYSLMAAGDFYGSSNGNNNNTDLAAYDPGVGTYLWSTSVGWAKIDAGAVAAFATGNFKGGTVAGLVASEPGAGTYLWANGVGWTKIDGGVYTIMAAGAFYGNGSTADLAAYDPGVGTFIWQSANGWTKIDNGAASEFAAGNFLGTSDGNNNRADLAAYFSGSGTYIWSSSAGWTKIDTGTSDGLAAISIGNGQSALLSYDQGAGVEEWQNGIGWNNINGSTVPMSQTQQALFATGNFTGDQTQEPVVGFSGSPGIWLDPPLGSSSGSSPLSNATVAATPTAVTVDNGASVDINTPSIAAVTFAGSSGTPQNEQSPAFATPIAGPSATPQNDQSPALADTIGGFASQDQPTLGYSANSGNSGGAASTAANIALLGSYMASSFIASSDGNGGTLVSEAAPAMTNPIGAIAPQQHALT